MFEDFIWGCGIWLQIKQLDSSVETIHKSL